MSTVTRRWIVSAARDGRNGPESVPLGRAVEWDHSNISVELDCLPAGNWWGGVAVLREEGGNPSAASAPAPLGYDLVAGKRGREPEGKTKWITVGSGQVIAGTIHLDFTTRPEGNWWDGKLRLFPKREKRTSTRN
jgi:hypothetical protein